MTLDVFPRVVTALRGASVRGLPAVVVPTQSLILDLGFDSLAIARLGLTLEGEFGFPILLDGWLSSAPDPWDLTVGSLCEFVASRQDGHESVAP